jgi:hypothetical protein
MQLGFVSSILLGVEVEDRAYETGLGDIRSALAQSARYLRPLMALRAS